MKIDSHQHFWYYNTEDYDWMSSGMKVLKKNYLPENLEPLLKSIEFDGSVVVQARQIVEESQMLLDLADENNNIRGVVGWVDICGTDLESQLKRFSAHKKFCGLRHIVHDEPDVNFMLRSEFINGLKLIEEYNLTYDLLIKPPHMSVTLELLKQFPEQPFVVDHIAKPYIKDKIITPWDEGIRRIAEYPNVYCKVSGMVTEADWKNWKPEDFIPYLDVIFEAFGLERVMIGSDWPVCTLAGEYTSVMGVVLEYIKQFPEQEQARVLGENACRFYNIAI